MKQFFEGWYYKHQSQGKTIALIPGRAGDGAFIQIVADKFSRFISFPLSEYVKTAGSLRIGDNIFSQSGITLSIHNEGFAIYGELQYGTITPLKSDIMGPFRFFPMECRHGVVSMRHMVFGALTANGEIFDLSDGIGYIESDSGWSFPQEYAWIQCCDFPDSESIMASVARIPFFGGCFRGCIAVIWVGEHEYRLATYLGARILRCEEGLILIGQGDYLLEITTEACMGHPLAAPDCGVMRRTIHENVSCPASFRFSKKGVLLFDRRSNHASYECMIPGS